MTHILEDSTHKIEGQPPQKRGQLGSIYIYKYIYIYLFLRGKAEGVGVERKHNSPVT